MAVPTLVGSAVGAALIALFSVFSATGGANLDEEIQKLKSINSHPSSIDQSNYPKQFGFLGSHPLVEKYYCSDLCPANSRVILVYGDVNTDRQCMAVGGMSLTDIAFRGYIGCAPLRCSQLEGDSAPFNATGTTGRCYS